MAEAAGQAAPQAPAEGIAEVWWARRQDASPRLSGLLDHAERERWAAYRRDADRERFLVGCGLAKTAIAARTGQQPGEVSFDRTCRRCGKPHGKPAVRLGDLEFSVAHSGDLVAVAVATAPVGVDVEQLEGRPHELGGGDPAPLARLVLAAEEQAALAALPASGRARAFRSRRSSSPRTRPRPAWWPGPIRGTLAVCRCTTSTPSPGTWRRWRSSAAATRSEPGTDRPCSRAWRPEPSADRCGRTRAGNLSGLSFLECI